MKLTPSGRRLRSLKIREVAPALLTDSNESGAHLAPPGEDVLLRIGE